MTFWEFLGVMLSSVGLFASVLGAFLTYAARHNGEATRSLMRSLDQGTKDLTRGMEERLVQMNERMSEILDRMDERANARHLEVTASFERMEAHVTEVLERMDRRADERHREVIQVIGALRAAD